MESRSTITAEINATFPDNNQKLITAEQVRAFMDIINQSKFNLLDDELLNQQVTIDGNTTTLVNYITTELSEVDSKVDRITRGSLPYTKITLNVNYQPISGNTVVYDVQSFNLFGDFGLPISIAVTQSNANNTGNTVTIELTGTTKSFFAYVISPNLEAIGVEHADCVGNSNSNRVATDFDTNNDLVFNLTNNTPLSFLHDVSGNNADIEIYLFERINNLDGVKFLILEES